MIKDYWVGDIIEEVEREDGKKFSLFEIIDGGMIIGFEKKGWEDGIGNVESFDVRFWDGKEGWSIDINEM